MGDAAPVGFLAETVEASQKPKEERANEVLPETKLSKKVDSTKLTPKPLEEEDDDWSSIPAFLRRPKNK